MHRHPAARLLRISLISSVAALAASGCGGGSGSPPPSGDAPPIVVTTQFPAGNASAPLGGPAYAITQIKTTLTGNPGSGNYYFNLKIETTFAQDITNALPAPGTLLSDPGNSNKLGLTTYLNTDGNDVTGGFQSSCTGSTTGAEFGITDGSGYSRQTDGNYLIIGSGAFAGVIEEAQTSVAGQVLTQSFGLTNLGLVNPGRPYIKIFEAAINGVGGAQVTDCAPTSGEVVVSSP